MNWSPQQDAALCAVKRWLQARDRQVFYLAGYAGTGKTTLARYLAADIGNVCYGAFTGKAASVMRNRGCEDATTIHRLIYRMRPNGTSKLKELQAAVEQEQDPDRRAKLERELRDAVKAAKAPRFELNPESPVRTAGLVVIDECSMVGERIGQDLLSFGVPVLVLGDPAQLPPVAGGGFFTSREPDAMLTEIHRQAEGSAILRLATAVREGRRLELGDYGEARVVRRGEMAPEELIQYDQMIVGKNSTRRGTNKRVRALLGFAGDLPNKGERLICLRNAHDRGLLNGETWNVQDAWEVDDELVSLQIENDGLEQQVVAWRQILRGQDLTQWDHDGDVDEFDWGYVITCHKSQGSQWPRVVVFDESFVFRQNARQWLYTAITRASEQLVVVV